MVQLKDRVTPGWGGTGMGTGTSEGDTGTGGMGQQWDRVVGWHRDKVAPGWLVQGQDMGTRHQRDGVSKGQVHPGAEWHWVRMSQGQGGRGLWGGTRVAWMQVGMEVGGTGTHGTGIGWYDDKGHGDRIAWGWDLPGMARGGDRVAQGWDGDRVAQGWDMPGPG